MELIKTISTWYMAILTVIVFISCLIMKFRRSGQDDYSFISLFSALGGIFGFFLWLVSLPIVVGIHFGAINIAWGIVASVIVYLIHHRTFKF